MSMLTLRGSVVNVFRRDARTAKDGQKFEASDHVQLLCSQEMQNGERKMELVTLRTDRLDEFEAAKGQEVRCDVGAFVGGGAIRFFLPQGAAVYRMAGETAQPLAPQPRRSSAASAPAAG